MGGDRDVLPAAARRARRRARARHAVAHARCSRDQLEAPGVARALPRASCARSGAETHRRDIAAAEAPASRAELERSAAPLRARRPSARGARGDLLARVRAARELDLVGDARRAARCSPPTPACGSSSRPAIASHRARFGAWDGGFWLPECAHAPWLDAAARGGRRARCRASTSTDAGSARRPAAAAAQRRRAAARADRPRADRPRVAASDGYPSRGAYRDTHRYTEHRHTPWAVDGAPYDPERGGRRRRARDARDFAAARASDGGLASCALDTELLGHFWHEGVDWLAAVIEACGAAGVELVPLDDALADVDAGGRRRAAGHELGRARATSPPGAPRRPAELAWRQRARRAARARRRGHPARARCASCWRCRPPTGRSWSTRETAGEYPRERADGHAAELERALADPAGIAPASAQSCTSLDLANPGLQG